MTAPPHSPPPPVKSALHTASAKEYPAPTHPFQTSAPRLAPSNALSNPTAQDSAEPAKAQTKHKSQTPPAVRPQSQPKAAASPSSTIPFSLLHSYVSE